MLFIFKINSEIWPPERIKCNLFQKKVSNIQYIASMYTRKNIFFNISFLVFLLEIRFLGPSTKKKNTKQNNPPPPSKKTKTKTKQNKTKKKQTQKTYSPKMSLVIRCDKKFEWLYVFPFQPRWHIWAAQATKWTKAIPSRPRKETITQNRQIDDPPGIQTLARMNILEMTVTTCTTMNLYHIFIKLEMDSCMFRNMLYAFYVSSTALPTIYLQQWKK